MKKLNKEDIPIIRKLGEIHTIADIANYYDVVYGTIYNILTGRTWSRVIGVALVAPEIPVAPIQGPKLSETDVRYIRNVMACGSATYASLATFLNVSVALVSQVAKYKIFYLLLMIN